MAILQADIVLIAPELTTVPAGVFTQVIADVVLELNPNAWGTPQKYDLACKYLAAHVISLIYPDLMPGLVKSEGAGQVQREYSVPDAVDLLETTRHGRQYQSLRRRNGLTRVGLT